MESLHDAVELGAVDLCGAVVDLLELGEQLVGMAVGTTAELSAVVREDDLDAPTRGLEREQHVTVYQGHGGHQHLVGVQPCPAMVRVAVDRGLQVHLAHAVQSADKEGVYRDQ